MASGATGNTGALTTRAALFAALGDPLRLKIADELATSDRTPGELLEWGGHRTHHIACRWSQAIRAFGTATPPPARPTHNAAQCGVRLHPQFSAFATGGRPVAAAHWSASPQCRNRTRRTCAPLGTRNCPSPRTQPQARRATSRNCHHRLRPGPRRPPAHHRKPQLTANDAPALVGARPRRDRLCSGI
ncbi:MAG: hypothetical protein RLZZ332_1304 [Actinomycetota bacterium]